MVFEMLINQVKRDVQGYENLSTTNLPEKGMVIIRVTLALLSWQQGGLQQWGIPFRRKTT